MTSYGDARLDGFAYPEAYRDGFAFGARYGLRAEVPRSGPGSYAYGYTGAYISGEDGSEAKRAAYAAYAEGYGEGVRARTASADSYLGYLVRLATAGKELPLP